MVLAAGMVFWIVRAILVAIPHLALTYPVKKWAALAAMVAGVIYNVFAGSEIATERSLIMTLVLLGAILADRPALSMRNLAIAAIAVLLLEPESLLGPSFQMSFAAVAALIALYERAGGTGMEPEAGHFSPFGLDQARAEKPPPAGLAGRILRKAWVVAVGAVLTTLVAEAATAPFGLYHFQRFTPYGVVGNALTLPLVSIVVMPAALIGVLAIPFGLDAPVWSIMGIGIDLMLRVSSMVAGWTGSIRTVQAFGAGALLLLSLAALCATLWRGWLRLGAIPLALAGMLLASRSIPPDLVVARDGRALAARAPDGRLAMVGRLGSFVVEQWLRADGDARIATDPSLFTQSRCDPSGCILIMPDGRALAHVLSQAAFEEDCRRAAILVTPLDAPAWCKPPVLIDRSTLAKNGAQAINLSTHGVAAASGARSERVNRPWIPKQRPVANASSGIPTARSSTQARPGPAAAPDRREIGGQDQMRTDTRSLISPNSRHTWPPVQRGSVAPQETNQLALNPNPVRPEHAGFIGRICGFQRNRRAAPAKTLQRRFLVIDERHDDVSGIGNILSPHDDRIAVENARLDHRILLALRARNDHRWRACQEAC